MADGLSENTCRNGGLSAREYAARYGLEQRPRIPFAAVGGMRADGGDLGKAVELHAFTSHGNQVVVGARAISTSTANCVHLSPDDASAASYICPTRREALRMAAQLQRFGSVTGRSGEIANPI